MWEHGLNTPSRYSIGKYYENPSHGRNSESTALMMMSAASFGLSQKTTAA
jgi:hypothetical protein